MAHQMARTQIFDEISKNDYPANLKGNAGTNETEQKMKPQWMRHQRGSNGKCSAKRKS